jgi:energy-converting hydrogenase Eha subunit B
LARLLATIVVVYFLAALGVFLLQSLGVRPYFAGSVGATSIVLISVAAAAFSS